MTRQFELAHHHEIAIQLRFPSTLLSLTISRLMSIEIIRNIFLSTIYRRTVLEGRLNNYDTLTSDLTDQISSNDMTSDVLRQKFSMKSRKKK